MKCGSTGLNARPTLASQEAPVGKKAQKKPQCCYKFQPLFIPWLEGAAHPPCPYTEVFASLSFMAIL